MKNTRKAQFDHKGTQFKAYLAHKAINPLIKRKCESFYYNPIQAALTVGKLIDQFGQGIITEIRIWDESAGEWESLEIWELIGIYLPSEKRCKECGRKFKQGEAIRDMAFLTRPHGPYQHWNMAVCNRNNATSVHGRKSFSDF